MIPQDTKAVRIGTVLVALLIVALLGIQIVTIGQERYEKWHNNSEKWCNDHTGDFEETLAGGRYSGLECTLPSGKTVDMGEVAYQDYPEDTDKLPKLENTPYRNAIWNQTEHIYPVAAITLAISGIVFGYVRLKNYLSDTKKGEDND